MKLHSQSTEFLLFFLILILFILPPVLTINEGISTFSTWSFPAAQLLRFLLSGFLYFHYLYSSKLLKKPDFQYVFYSVLLPSTFCLGALLCISFLIKGVSIILPVIIKNIELSGNTELGINRPDGIIQICFCLLNFVFAAFFEEVIYRFYLPEFLLRIIKNKKKIFILLIEIIALLIFAFSHLYLGILSVLNAGLAHIVLRICYKKSGNIYSGFTAHFVYNVMSLYLL